MASTKEHIKKFKAAHRLASDILASAHSGLPDHAEVHHLATALFVNGIKAADGEPQLNRHAGQDRDSEKMLRDSYRAGTENDQQSEA